MYRIALVAVSVVLWFWLHRLWRCGGMSKLIPVVIKSVRNVNGKDWLKLDIIRLTWISLNKQLSIACTFLKRHNLHKHAPYCPRCLSENYTPPWNDVWALIKALVVHHRHSVGSGRCLPQPEGIGDNWFIGEHIRQCCAVDCHMEAEIRADKARNNKHPLAPNNGTTVVWKLTAYNKKTKDQEIIATLHRKC